MNQDPTYDELAQRVEALERELEVRRQVEEKHNRIYNNLKDGVWIYDLATDRFTFTSDVLHQMSGYSSDEEANLGLSDIFPPDQLEISMGTFLYEIERDGEAGVDPDRRILLQLEQLRKDGSRQPIEVTASFLRNDKGEIIEIVGVTRDITERKQAEEEKNRLLTDIQAALERVKQLSGMLPICSYCKRVRDDKGYYHQIESYIREHSEADFSHGICRECAEEHFPGMDLYDD